MCSRVAIAEPTAGPVVGFAWSPSKYGGKAVFRGGFGISYNQNEIAITTNGSGNPPNAVQASFTCPYPFKERRMTSIENTSSAHSVRYSARGI